MFSVFRSNSLHRLVYPSFVFNQNWTKSYSKSSLQVRAKAAYNHEGAISACWNSTKDCMPKKFSDISLVWVGQCLQGGGEDLLWLGSTSTKACQKTSWVPSGQKSEIPFFFCGLLMSALRQSNYVMFIQKFFFSLIRKVLSNLAALKRRNFWCYKMFDEETDILSRWITVF